MHVLAQRNIMGSSLACVADGISPASTLPRWNKAPAREVRVQVRRLDPVLFRDAYKILCVKRFCAPWGSCIIHTFTTALQILFLTGPLKWEKVPSASEKNSQSKAWYTVKKDSVHIKTKTFSFWSIFACGGGGPKRKRATVFANKPNAELDTICFRFYIYSDNEDSKKVGAAASTRIPL